MFYQMTGCAAVTELLDRHTLAYRLYTLVLAQKLGRRRTGLQRIGDGVDEH